MIHIYVIARKEFSDIIRSNIILVVLAVYCVLLFYSYYMTFNVINNNLLQFGLLGPNNNPAVSPPGDFITVLCDYGGLVAVVLALSSMYNEVGNSALSTLIVKPVYRDMILNGKLLGAVFFAFCLFIFTTLIEISLNFVFWGEHFNSMFPAFLGELPLVLISYLLVFMIFYLLTVLMFLLVSRSSLAFFLAFISWILIYKILPTEFSICISSFFSNSDQMNWIICSLSPYVMLQLIFKGTNSIFGAISVNYLEFFKLIMYVGVLLIACYTIFLRRDIA